MNWKNISILIILGTSLIVASGMYINNKEPNYSDQETYGIQIWVNEVQELNGQVNFEIQTRVIEISAWNPFEINEFVLMGFDNNCRVVGEKAIGGPGNIEGEEFNTNFSVNFQSVPKYIFLYSPSYTAEKGQNYPSFVLKMKQRAASSNDTQVNYQTREIQFQHGGLFKRSNKDRGFENCLVEWLGTV